MRGGPVLLILTLLHARPPVARTPGPVPAAHRPVLAAALAAVCGLAVTVVAGCSPAGHGAAPPATPAHAAPAHRRPPPPASYYLALGDSLSQGVQPDSSGASVETRYGYADLVYAALRKAHPGLKLVKLGCPGETTATMVNGGMCHYRAGSQLAAAMSFLAAHRGRVALITIDIGANDPDSCLTQPAAAKLASCVGKSIPQATANLTKILTSLRTAYPHGRMIAMNYYLPALAQWRNGLAGQMLARLTAVAAHGYNSLLTKIYQSFGVRIANVFGAFHTTDFSGQVPVPGAGTLPANVAAICRWTWMCAAPPRGPNQHANQAGYQVIARAFLLAGPGAPPG
jgi:lysophospholipase L1-like esterase